MLIQQQYCCSTVCIPLHVSQVWRIFDILDHTSKFRFSVLMITLSEVTLF